MIASKILWKGREEVIERQSMSKYEDGFTVPVGFC